MSNLLKAKNVVTIYGCGGMGVNLVSDLLAGEGQVGFATTKTCFIDTSKANLQNKGLNEDDVYLFEGIDGSGKERALNYEDIDRQAKAVLQKFKPTDLNIIVHSGGGGSGSVIGPVLVSELKEHGHQVIVVMVGSTDTRIEIENTIKTLKSYEAIANDLNSPVVTHYLENSAEHSRTKVNKMARSAVSLLCGLYSGQHEELDSADLKNWLDFLKFQGGHGELSSLNFSTGNSDLSTAGTIASVATLATPDMSTRLHPTPAYQATGYVPEVWRPGVKDSLQVITTEPIHFLISTDFITGAEQRLKGMLKDVDEAYASRVSRRSILDKGDTTTKRRVVL